MRTSGPSSTADHRQTKPSSALVWHGRDGSQRVSLSSAAIAVAATLLCAATIATAGYATYDVVAANYSATSAARQAAMRRAYEDRIDDLRTRVDIATSRQLIDQRAVEQRMALLLEKQAELGARQAHVAQAAKRSGIALPTITTRPATHPKPRPKQAIAPLGLRLGSLDAPSHAFTGNAETKPVPNVFVEVETSLAETERKQVADVTALHNEAVRKARGLKQILAKRGVKVPAETGTGGPLIELRGMGNFSAAVSKLDATLETLAQVRRAARAVPHGSPAPGRKISSRFGARRDPFTKRGAMHGGMDYRAPRGAKVIATADGRVTKAGRLGGYGNLVEIDHGGGITTRYAHLSRIKVKRGQRVTRGTLVGKVGSTGRSTGPHLHYEVRRKGRVLDPMHFVKLEKRLKPYL